MLHLPDLRLADIETTIAAGRGTFPLHVEHPTRAMLCCALSGRFRIRFEHDGSTFDIEQGTAIGLQIGLKHRWTGLPSDGDHTLFVSSIDRRSALLQGLDHEMIIVPADGSKSSMIIAHAVAIHCLEHEAGPSGDDMIIRRCAEICMAELVRFARMEVVQGGEIPSGIAHDEYLLRAWSAYYAAPRARWTVKALAQAAGISRTAFFDRFRDAVGVPPLTAITDLRLSQAEVLLREQPMPLIEIAFTVGYNSEAAFIRAFQRKYGVPPGRYRQEHVALATN